MNSATLENARAAWASSYAGLTQQEIDRRVLVFGALVRGIAERGAVAQEEFGRETGLAPEAVSELFSGFAASGMETDELGRVVGAALTTRQTAHSVTVAGKQLFAWCALDTLFIPGLLSEPAEVESTCPVSGATIRLTVTPDGVSAAKPPDAVLSVVLPGVGSQQASIGPASPT